MERYSEPPPLVARLSHVDGQPTVELYDALWLSCLERLSMDREDDARAWAHRAIGDRKIVLIWDVLDPAEQEATEGVWQRWLSRAEPGVDATLYGKTNARERQRPNARGLPAKRRRG